VFSKVSISSFMEKGRLFRHVALNALNPLNAELNPIRHLLALVGPHHILHVSRVRVKPNVPIYDRLCTFTIKYCRADDSILIFYSTTKQSLKLSLSFTKYVVLLKYCREDVQRSASFISTLGHVVITTPGGKNSPATRWIWGMVRTPLKGSLFLPGTDF
jgi:hypothetical protein